jgi:hypothetical protein
VQTTYDCNIIIIIIIIIPFVVVSVILEYIACLQSDKADQARVTVAGEPAFKCDALAKTLGSSPDRATEISVL